MYGSSEKGYESMSRTREQQPRQEMVEPIREKLTIEVEIVYSRKFNDLCDTSCEGLREVIHNGNRNYWCRFFGNQRLYSNGYSIKRCGACLEATKDM